MHKDSIEMYKFLTSGEKTYFLRRTKLGRAFCVSCHMVKPEGHVEMLIAAHPSKKYKVMGKSKTIDPNIYVMHRMSWRNTG